MALAEMLSFCVGPGSQVAGRVSLLQHVLPAAGINGLHLLRVFSSAPAPEPCTICQHHDQLQEQARPADMPLWQLTNSHSSCSSSDYSSIHSSRCLYAWSGLVPGTTRQFASMAAAQGLEADSGSEDDEGVNSSHRLSPEEYRRKYQMWVHPPDAPAPCQTFEDAQLPPKLLRALQRHGFSAPTYIQAQAWPIAFQGRDLVAIASTGSGKTAGFLLPAFIHIQQQQELQRQHEQQHGGGAAAASSNGSRSRNGWSRWNKPQSWMGGAAAPPVALVLAPTRELAQQTQQEAERLGGPLNIKTACLYGGAAKGPQGSALSRGPQLIIATPGRLMDFVNSGEANISRVSMLILDEADRMLDMGFEPQIRELLDNMPGGEYAVLPKPEDRSIPPRQTLFFSATWPKEVQSIARQLCRNEPVRVFVGNVQEKLVANRDVTQLVAMLSSTEDRLPALTDYLHEHLHGAERIDATSSFNDSFSSSSSSRRHQQDRHAKEHPSAPLEADEVHPRVVVFAGTKKDCDHLARQLSLEGIRAAAVHGDKSQYERDNVLRSFRQGRVPVLVATDVAARGLDIPGVTAVVNYEFPQDHEMYIHRIGRTGRAGRKGESLTLLTPRDAPVTPLLVQIMQDAGQTVPADLAAVAARVRKPAQTKQRYGSSSNGGGSRRGSGSWNGSSRGTAGSGHYGGRGGRGGGRDRPGSSRGYEDWDSRSSSRGGRGSRSVDMWDEESPRHRNDQWKP